MPSHYTRLNDAAWLREQYVDQHRSAVDLASEIGCHRQAVVRALRSLGIETHTRTRPLLYPQLRDRGWLATELATKTQSQIARELGASLATVSAAVVSAGLASRTKSEAVREALAKRYPNGRKGPDHPGWKGGRWKTKAGYVRVYAPEHPRANGGSVFEHILVMEEILNRHLEPGEIVHHDNRNRDDNRPENLVLTRNGEHVSRHWADGTEARDLRERNAELEAELEAIRKMVR